MNGWPEQAPGPSRLVFVLAGVLALFLVLILASVGLPS